VDDGGRPEAEALVERTLAEWGTAMEAGDLERVMTLYSTDFACFDAPDRQAMSGLVAGMKDQGALDDIEVFIDRAEMTRDGDRMRVFPVELVGSAVGVIVIRLTLRLEDGNWRIVGQEW